ncbi:hypothetical protein ABZS96_12385 [Streptomyces avermitilis]|uniref:hypothetical protein n=1 Tax=Streptomyces avermitilis TaxID=33903 RepID=UPI0033B50ADA
MDLTERRTALDVPGPDTSPVPVFVGRGFVTWQVADPVEAVRHRAADVPEELRRRLLTGLRRLALTHPRSHLSRATVALDDLLSDLPLPGYTLRWSVSLSAPKV